MNPFITLGYAGEEYFCDRMKETEIISNALKNGRNVALISPRRLGKTGLILHTFARMKADDPDIRCFYMDIFSTRSSAEFVSRFATTVLGKLDGWTKKVISNVTKVMSHCRPTFSYDPITGTPTMSLDISPDAVNVSLQDILKYLDRSGHQCYVAIDEFQQIASYPQKGMDAELRSWIQFTPNVHFIFAGSQQHMMNELFSSPKNPFFQTVQKMGLGPIDENVYFKFAQKHMQNGGKELNEEVFHDVYSFSIGCTWYVQDLMNRLYEFRGKCIDFAKLRETYRRISAEGEMNFAQYRSLLSKGQLNLLQAIADEGQVRKPYEYCFIAKHGLSAPSTVRQSLDFLLKLGAVAESENGYYVYDRYLNLWLRSHV